MSFVITQKDHNQVNDCPIILRVPTKSNNYYDFNIKSILQHDFDGLNWIDMGIRSPVVIESKYKIDEAIPNIDNVYLLWAKGSTFYKIGHSRRASRRIKEFETGNPPHIELVYVAFCPGDETLEKIFHKKFETNREKKKGTGNEWFNFDEEQFLVVIREYARIRFQYNRTERVNNADLNQDEDEEIGEIEKANEGEKKEKNIGEDHKEVIQYNIRDIGETPFIPFEILLGYNNARNQNRWITLEEHEQYGKVFPLCSFRPILSSKNRICGKIAVNMFTEIDISKWRCDSKSCKNKGRMIEHFTNCNLKYLLVTVFRILGEKILKINSDNFTWNLSDRISGFRWYYKIQSSDPRIKSIIDINNLTNHFSPEFYLIFTKEGIRVEYIQMKEGTGFRDPIRKKRKYTIFMDKPGPEARFHKLITEDIFFNFNDLTEWHRKQAEIMREKIEGEKTGTCLLIEDKTETLIWNLEKETIVAKLDRNSSECFYFKIIFIARQCSKYSEYSECSDKICSEIKEYIKYFEAEDFTFLLCCANEKTEIWDINRKICILAFTGRLG